MSNIDRTRPSKQCKSLINFLILKQYLEKNFFVEQTKMYNRNISFFVENKYTMRDSSNESQKEKLSSWLNSALRDDELYKVIPDGTWWYWVGRV